MSGPKAVRVISRAERIARCEDLLAQLEAQATEWLRTGNRLGVLSEQDRRATEEKVSLLREALSADKFDQVERQTQTVIEFLRRDMEERIANQAVKKRRAKTVRRRLGAAAEQVLSMLESGNQPIDPALTKMLQSAVGGRIDDPMELETVIGDAISVLSTGSTSTELNADQRALAQALRGDAKVRTVTDWIIKNAHFDDDRATRVEDYIADLEVSEGAEVAAPFSERVNDIREVENKRKRQMLFDTLIIDLAAEVKKRERKRRLHGRAISLRAIIERDVELAQHQISQRIERLLEQWNDIGIDLVEDVLAEVAGTVEQRQQVRAAELNRSAMLEAFSELGYEIREGMETAWVEQKRIVVSKSHQIGHGVEVSGSAEAGRLQVRPVRFADSSGSSANRQKDSDIETIWCSEFKELQRILDRKGGKLAIEKAKAVGETPVKVVPAPASTRRRETAAKPGLRKRPLS